MKNSNILCKEFYDNYFRIFFHNMQGPLSKDFENNKYGILQNISIHLEEHCVEMYPGSGMMEKCKIYFILHYYMIYNDIHRKDTA